MRRTRVVPSDDQACTCVLIWSYAVSCTTVGPWPWSTATPPAMAAAGTATSTLAAASPALFPYIWVLLGSACTRGARRRTGTAHHEGVAPDRVFGSRPVWTSARRDDSCEPIMGV